MRPSLLSVYLSVVIVRFSAMAHCKNVVGGPNDEDPRPPPRLIAKGKGEKDYKEEAEVR